MGSTKICRYCGQIIYKDAENCEYCGKFLNKEHDNKDLFCAKCKAPVNTDDNFCQNCGAIFNIPEQNDIEEPAQHNINGIHYNIGILLTSLAVSISYAFFASTGNDGGFGQNFIFFGIAFIVAEIFLYIYFLPSIIAIENNNPNVYLVYICNLLLGITIIGWFVSFGIALNNKKKFS